MEKKIQEFIFNENWRLARHLLFWGFMYLDELLSFVGLTPPLDLTHLLVLEIGLDVFIVYINLYILLPVFLLKRRYVPYLIFTALSLIFNALVNQWATSIYYEYENVLSFHIGSILFTMSVLGTAIAIKLAKFSLHQSQMREKIEGEKMRTELVYLKQQVNPHFLFNVLNSLYVQSKTDSSTVPDMVMQLSDLLRYQIYESAEHDQIALEKEMEFLKNYLDLEKVRRENLDIIWEVDGDPKPLVIEPILFLPLIENAVKHSRKAGIESEFIDVRWSISDSRVELKVSNSFDENRDYDNGGFGVDNLKKRLDLVYSNAYTLDLEKEGGIFIAKLMIQTDE